MSTLCNIDISQDLNIFFCVKNKKGWCPKAELLRLNHTQFPSLGIFVSKKVGNQKTEGYFISFKNCMLRWSYFFRVPTFFIYKKSQGWKIKCKKKYLKTYL